MSLFKSKSQQEQNINNDLDFSAPTSNKLELKKAHVPIKTCLKIAFKNIWKKKFSMEKN